MKRVTEKAVTSTIDVKGGLQGDPTASFTSFGASPPLHTRSKKLFDQPEFGKPGI